MAQKSMPKSFKSTSHRFENALRGHPEDFSLGALADHGFDNRCYKSPPSPDKLQLLQRRYIELFRGGVTPDQLHEHVHNATLLDLLGTGFEWVRTPTSGFERQIQENLARIKANMCQNPKSLFFEKEEPTPQKDVLLVQKEDGQVFLQQGRKTTPVHEEERSNKDDVWSKDNRVVTDSDKKTSHGNLEDGLTRTQRRRVQRIRAKQLKKEASSD